MRDFGDVCGARNTQFDQKIFGLFRAETVSAYDWRDRIGDLCVAEYLAQLDTVHLVRYSTSLSLHFGMVAPSDYHLVFIKLIDVVAMLVFALGGGLLSRSLMKPKITASSSVGGQRRIFLPTRCRSQVLISGGGKSSVIPDRPPPRSSLETNESVSRRAFPFHWACFLQGTQD